MSFALVNTSMWVSRLVLGSILIFARGQCQKTICDIDPELLFFDDEELEKLKNSFQAGGECSPIDLKGELENSLQTQGKDVRDLSSRDRTVFEYLESLEHMRSNDRSSPDFYFYLGNHEKPTASSQFRRNVSPEGLRTSLSNQKPGNFNQHSINSALPINQQNTQFARLVRPSWNQVLDDLWIKEQNSQMKNGNKNSGQTQENSDNFVNSNNRFAPQVVFTPNRRPPLATNKPNRLFTPRPNQPLLQDQGRRPLPEENDLIMPDSVTESTTLPGPPTWATPPSPCVRSCPNTPEYNPICGTDRITYRNPGRLRCEQQCGKGGVSINHYGNCVVTPADPLVPQTTSLSTRDTSPSRVRPPPSFRFNT